MTTTPHRFFCRSLTAIGLAGFLLFPAAAQAQYLEYRPVSPEPEVEVNLDILNAIPGAKPASPDIDDAFPPPVVQQRRAPLAPLLDVVTPAPIAAPAPAQAPVTATKRLVKPPADTQKKQPKAKTAQKKRLPQAEPARTAHIEWQTPAVESPAQPQTFSPSLVVTPAVPAAEAPTPPVAPSVAETIEKSAAPMEAAAVEEPSRGLSLPPENLIPEKPVAATSGLTPEEEIPFPAALLQDADTAAQDSAAREADSAASMAALARAVEAAEENTNLALALPAAALHAPVEQPATPAPAVPTMGDLLLEFDGNSSKLSDATQKKLLDLLPHLNDGDDRRLQVRAYASGEKGSKSSARRISLSRALAVRSFLMDNGIKPARVDVRAMGTETDRSPIDRVDILFAR